VAENPRKLMSWYLAVGDKLKLPHAIEKLPTKQQAFSEMPVISA
jgi:hypothetical protein